MKPTLQLSPYLIGGEIDNRVAGRTTGLLFLEGVDSPLELILGGDCWRDLAGCKLEFSNLEPVSPWPGNALKSPLKGQIGDTSAAKKIPDTTAPDDTSPEIWRPAFSFEFFDEQGQRYLAESTRFQLTISEAVWFMDKDEDLAQRMSNQQAMRNYVELRLGRPAPPPRGEHKEGNEFAWEQHLQYSDRLSELYEEVMQKYADDSDSETKEAFAMGWDHLLGALADESESIPQGSDFPVPPFTDAEWSHLDFDNLDEEEFDKEIEMVQHPLQARAMDILSDHSEAIDRLRLKIPAAQVDTFYVLLLKVSAKLAAALNGDTLEQAPGYALAVLKRCINWLQEAIALLGDFSDALGIRRTENLKRALFALREGILEIRDELKHDEQN